MGLGSRAFAFGGALPALHVHILSAATRPTHTQERSDETRIDLRIQADHRGDQTCRGTTQVISVCSLILCVPPALLVMWVYPWWRGGEAWLLAFRRRQGVKQLGESAKPPVWHESP